MEFPMQMINVFVKQTTTVVSQRVSQLIGAVSDSDFQQKACELYKFFYPENLNLEPNKIQLIQSDILCRRMEVTVIAAQNLPKTDLVGSVDPLCQVTYGGTVHQTKVKKMEYNPSFEDESFLFDKSENSSSPSPLLITVLDWDRFKSNEVIGSAYVSCDTLDGVWNASPGYCIELELPLTKDKIPVINAQNLPSVAKIRLKNAGNAISGCDIAEFKNFFQLYDANGDGNVSEEEFLSMLRDVRRATMLFTGTESGDSILDSLSPLQVKALLNHQWAIPGKDQKSPLESVIGNIRSQSIGQHESLGLDDKCPETEDSHVENHEKHKTYSDKSRTVEESREQLKTLARKLRKCGVISLPTLVWGEGSNSSPESLESTLIR